MCVSVASMASGSSLLHAALGRSAPRVSASASGAMWELLVGVLVTMSPYVAQLRAAMGSAVLLLPSTSVLPVDTLGGFSWFNTAVMAMVGAPLEAPWR